MIATLAPVSLDELVAGASLLTRVDRKYAVTGDRAREVLDDLPAGTRVLEIDGRRALRYASCYFDTADLLSYRLAAQSRRRRFKLRTRAYLDSDAAYLEVKTRGARSTTVKERIGHDPGALDRLPAAGLAYAREQLAPLGLPAPTVPALRPTLVTRYRRTTLLTPEGRATIDTRLEWELADGRTLRLPDLVIVETKSGQRPGEIDRLLWHHRQRPVALSKFATGLAALRPDLPHNKWTRVLRRHFIRS